MTLDPQGPERGKQRGHQATGPGGPGSGPVAPASCRGSLLLPPLEVLLLIDNAAGSGGPRFRPESHPWLGGSSELLLHHVAVVVVRGRPLLGAAAHEVHERRGGRSNPLEVVAQGSQMLVLVVPALEKVPWFLVVGLLILLHLSGRAVENFAAVVLLFRGQVPVALDQALLGEDSTVCQVAPLLDMLLLIPVSSVARARADEDGLEEAQEPQQEGEPEKSD